MHTIKTDAERRASLPLLDVRATRRCQDCAGQVTVADAAAGCPLCPTCLWGKPTGPRVPTWSCPACGRNLATSLHHPSCTIRDQVMA